MKNDTHILSREGILTSFSISKKIPVDTIKKISKGLNSKKNNKSSMLMKSLMIKKIQSEINIKEIPGFLTDVVDNIQNADYLEDLDNFSFAITQKIFKKSVDKYYNCYIINNIVNMLRLTEEDFEEFRKKFLGLKDEESDD